MDGTYTREKLYDIKESGSQPPFLIPADLRRFRKYSTTEFISDHAEHIYHRGKYLKKYRKMEELLTPIDLQIIRVLNRHDHKALILWNERIPQEIKARLNNFLLKVREVLRAQTAVMARRPDRINEKQEIGIKDEAHQSSLEDYEIPPSNPQKCAKISAHAVLSSDPSTSSSSCTVKLPANSNSSCSPPSFLRSPEMPVFIPGSLSPFPPSLFVPSPPLNRGVPSLVDSAQMNLQALKIQERGAIDRTHERGSANNGSPLNTGRESFFTRPSNWFRGSVAEKPCYAQTSPDPILPKNVC